MKRKTTAKPKTVTESTPMNLKDIESLIKFVQTSGVAEVSLEQKDIKITIKTTHGQTSTHVMHAAPVMPQVIAQSAPAPAPAPDPAPAPAPAPEPVVEPVVEPTPEPEEVAEAPASKPSRAKS